MNQLSKKRRNILSVKNLEVIFHLDYSDVHAVNSISFSLETGQSLGIVGESGSGKSVTSLSLLDLYRKNPKVETHGSMEVIVDDKRISISEIADVELQKIRGRHIGLVLQEPGSALNPARKIGAQLEEVIRIHEIGDKSTYKETVLKTLERVALKDNSRIYNSYPHELSGGQLQRVCIAMAIIVDPHILICDEATSALDLTIQKEILSLLKDLKEELGLSMIFISHDLDVVRAICDRVIVMKDGLIVEEGQTHELFDRPKHVYTKELTSNRPSLKSIDKDQSIEATHHILLDINGLSHQYPKRALNVFGPKEYDLVLSKVSFQLHQSEILGIVGESGSGKSTIAKALVGIINPTGGTIKYFPNKEESKGSDGLPKKDVQLIFQDPYSSLNPSMSIGASIYELISYHKLVPKAKIKGRVSLLLNTVGLSEEYYHRLPHELSGGQRQRVCIAKAIALEPNILICDESVSALDVTIQSKILTLLADLRKELGLSMIFISHDLAVINTLCDRVLVMEAGNIVESGTPQQVIHDPQHIYTQKLVSSVLSGPGE